MKNIIQSIILILSILLPNLGHASNIRYVNIDVILSFLPEIQLASKETKVGLKNMEEEIFVLAKDFKKRVTAFNDGKDMMLQDDANKELKVLLEMENNIKKVTAKLENEIQIKNEATLIKVQMKINEIIKVIAKSNNYDMVLYKDIAYVDEKSDITNLVISSLKKVEKE